MSNTYSQIYIHVVFAVKHRSNLIDKLWKDDLYKYITGIVTNKQHKLIIINGMPDHLHIFIGLNPVQSISSLMQDVKSSSSKWINESGFLQTKFEWQAGFGAFSYSKSDIASVCKYIENQEKHHQKETFISEYREILKKLEVNFDDRYIFQELI
jgi:putative transposase